MGAPAIKSSMPGVESEATAAIPLATQDEVEWEYEYDENETEDYYFTLDVTTHQASRTGDHAPAAKRRKLTGPSNGTVTSGPTILSAADAQKTFNVTSQPEPKGRLQVLDLQTEDPLVLLDGQLYSCRWSTDIGTQFYVAKSNVAEKPLRAGRVLDVVGLSRTRLVGSPVTAQRRRTEMPVESVGATPANAIAVDEGEDDDDEAHGGEDAASTPKPAANASLQYSSTSADRFAKARQQAKNPEAQARLSFLERLSAIKQKKGEIDQVPISGVKHYEPPANQDEIRRAAEAADATRKVQESSTTGDQSRQRGPYSRKQSPATPTTDTPNTEQTRKKRGPKSSTTVRSSLGLAHANG